MTKNTSYHYSIIIPHKNTPRLLERCLCSIPTWDEIQIIIIDDNSNSESVDFSHFPGNGRKNTEVLFTKEGKGAGYARNIGLSHARGKWIIFADADDFFTANCFTILNEYMDSPHKVIYFNVRFVMSDDPSQESRRGTYYTNFFNDVNPENKLRYQSQVPWGKMIRRSFLSTFHIQFDETRIANDVYFSCLVGIYAPKSNHRQKNHLLLYRIRPVPCYVQTRPREFNHTVQRKHEMQQTVATRKNPLLPVTTSVVYPFGKNKRMAPRQILF